MTSDWDRSAAAWIAVQGDDGDFGRAHVLDAPMLALVAALAPATALDVGCGEGRFCRLLRQLGVATIGVDPTAALIDCARARDPEGDYRLAAAETMAVDPVDLVVCYLSLIDMPDLDAALAAIVAAIRPGGHLLIANLNSFNTAAVHLGWVKPILGEASFPIDHYLEERARRTAWAGIDILNHHRPMKRYMQALLGHGLQLRHFDEPAATGGPADKRKRYNRVPNFHIMLWQKP